MHFRKVRVFYNRRSGPGISRFQRVEEAFARAEAAEKIAKIALMAKLLGKEQPLPSGEKERLAGRG